MKTSVRRTGLVSAIVALAAVGACSNKQDPKIDASLKADLAAVGGTPSDLELAPTSAKSSAVVSEIEGGPQSAPKKVAKAPPPRPVQHKAPQIAAPRQIQEPAQAEVAEAPAPQPAPVIEQPAVQAPRPTPAPAQQQDRRVYKTEAEIFRQMPWIRP